MKKLVSMLLSLCLVLSLTAFAAAEGYTAGVSACAYLEHFIEKHYKQAG